MKLNLNFLLLFVAFALFLWAGAVALTWITTGNFFAILSFGLASYVASHVV